MNESKVFSQYYLTFMYVIYLSIYFFISTNPLARIEVVWGPTTQRHDQFHLPTRELAIKHLRCRLIVVHHYNNG